MSHPIRRRPSCDARMTFYRCLLVGRMTTGMAYLYSTLSGAPVRDAWRKHGRSRNVRSIPRPRIWRGRGGRSGLHCCDSDYFRLGAGLFLRAADGAQLLLSAAGTELFLSTAGTELFLSAALRQPELLQ